MDSQSIREAFTKFFVERGHQSVSRSSLIPGNDPTLLFTNSGMVQFKDVFLGSDKRSYTRATTVQPSVRAGGKHNDLDNVGYTARHHTFFEMLGNFSFGDYFKKDAIYFAWDFLTKVVKLPKEKLWVTVYEKDDEAADIWINQIGVDPNRVSRIGSKDNFWQMGDTGPCGPCTEIFYDHGPEIFGGPPGSPDADGDRYIEIWNLVFMQYNRDEAGNLTPLPKPSVDTGMGLERLAAILQGVHDNYDIDTFKFLIQKIAELLKVKNLQEKSLRVIADHIRSTSFLITDGVMPANEGRGYVLRRIIRRAIRHGEKLGAREVFFYRLVDPLIEIMGKAYPELKANRNLISDILEKEEVQFLKTLSNGLKLYQEATANFKPNAVVPGELLFKLYDTYGFPIDLTQDLSREKNWEVDMSGFEKAMAQQRERARSSSSFKEAYRPPVGLDQKSKFLGYEKLSSESTVEAIYAEGQSVDEIHEGQLAQIILNQTPFYAESGGQVGDQGVLKFKTGEFVVEDTQKNGEAICHLGILKSGVLKKSQEILAQVDSVTRDSTRLNHSATHLLDAALREILGEHVLQKGSQVRPDRLRFDFSHPKALTSEEISEIEARVNQEILKNLNAETIVTDLESAKKMGAIALFGEKYGETVRVVKMGDFSLEFCGGTHVSRTGDIGLFKIISESSVASGVRRIEAITGQAAFEYFQLLEKQRNNLGQLLKISPDKLETRVAELLEKIKQQEKKMKELSAQAISGHGFQNAISPESIASSAVLLGEETYWISAELPLLEVKTLREWIDALKTNYKKAVILLASLNSEEQKVNLLAGVTDGLTQQIKAGELVAHIAPMVGGKGGGRADFAQAGGTDLTQVSVAIEEAKKWVSSKI